jgi:Spy/CpxP family protein refolding chaperone
VRFLKSARKNQRRRTINRFHVLAFGTILIVALNVPAQQTTTTPGSASQSGQGRPGMPDDVPSADDQLKTLTIKLDLTDDQQATIRPILEGLRDATVKISRNQNLSREQRLARVRPLRYKARDQIREILNDEQKEKLERYMRGPHAKMHGNLSGVTSSPPPHKD